jgi:predicted esterase
VLHAGEPLAAASAALILIHGRGATAESILSLGIELDVPGFAFLAPQASGHSWYPNRFMAPLSSNEPHLTSALAVISAHLESLEAAGLPADRCVLLGFSQGACLSLEFAVRHARRFGAVVALSGGLIGPEGTPRACSGSLGGTPVFIGCGDGDAHIPVYRVHESADVMRRIGGNVTEHASMRAWGTW